MKKWMLLLLACLLPPAAQAHKTEKATFAAGCFWCTEEAFEKVPGVDLGGLRLHGRQDSRTRPTSRCRAACTGHTEVVEVTFDPAKVSYDKLLDVFWLNHDPTVLDRQFCDSRLAVPAGDLLPLRGAEASRRGLQGEVGEGEAVPAADPDADHQGGRVLAGRGLPPGLLQEERAAVQVLRHRLRPLLAARQPVGLAAQQVAATLELAVSLQVGDAAVDYRDGGGEGVGHRRQVGVGADRPVVADRQVGRAGDRRSISPSVMPRWIEMYLRKSRPFHGCGVAAVRSAASCASSSSRRASRCSRRSPWQRTL